MIIQPCACAVRSDESEIGMECCKAGKNLLFIASVAASMTANKRTNKRMCVCMLALHLVLW